MKLQTLICGAVLAASPLLAQQGPPPGGPQQGGDPLAGQLYPPELVMQNQHALGLTDDQQKSLRAAVKESQGDFTDLQWQVHAEMEALQELMKAERADEKQTLAQLDKLLKVENQIKRAQLTLAIRIKNILTAEQQQKLRALRRPMRGPGGPGGPSGQNALGGQRGPGGPPPQDGPPPQN